MAIRNLQEAVTSPNVDTARSSRIGRVLAPPSSRASPIQFGRQPATARPSSRHSRQSQKRNGYPTGAAELHAAPKVAAWQTPAQHQGQGRNPPERLAERAANEPDDLPAKRGEEASTWLQGRTRARGLWRPSRNNPARRSRARAADRHAGLPSVPSIRGRSRRDPHDRAAKALRRQARVTRRRDPGMEGDSSRAGVYRTSHGSRRRNRRGPVPPRIRTRSSPNRRARVKLPPATSIDKPL